jgi:cytidylate kinase
MSIITISRGTFSGGEALAKEVAERLEYRCISREVILEAAREYGIPAAELGAAMEQPPSFWERVMGARESYLLFMQAALCKHAREGHLVYHGRVGHLLLPGVTHVIRVRVIADPEFRVRAVMQAQHLGREEALAYIAKVDRERRQWVRFLFDVDWEDPRLYDVVLNLSRLRLATASETVVHLAERAEFQPTVESEQSMRDLALTSHIAALLASNPHTQEADLHVVARDGIVTISGTGHWPEVEATVFAVVRQVEGVKEVRSEIKIVPMAYYPTP